MTMTSLRRKLLGAALAALVNLVSVGVSASIIDGKFPATQGDYWREAEATPLVAIAAGECEMACKAKHKVDLDQCLRVNFSKRVKCFAGLQAKTKACEAACIRFDSSNVVESARVGDDDPIGCFWTCESTYFQCTAKCAVGDNACAASCLTSLKTVCAPQCTTQTQDARTCDEDATATFIKCTAACPVGAGGFECTAACRAPYAKIAARCQALTSCIGQCDGEYAGCHATCMAACSANSPMAFSCTANCNECPSGQCRAECHNQFPALAGK